MSKNKLNIYKEPIFALLKQNKTSSDGLPITHLSFGLFNGKFHLNADDRDKFMELYINAINNGVDDLTILEKQLDYGPIIVDIDLEIPNDDYKSGRLYDIKLVENIINKYIIAIKKYLLIKEEIKVYLFEKNNVTLKENEVKDGFHLIIRPISTHFKIKHLIRNEVVKMCEDDNTFKEYLGTPDKIIDKAVVSTNAWFLYGSKKPNGLNYYLTKIYDENNNITYDNINKISYNIKKGTQKSKEYSNDKFIHTFSLQDPDYNDKRFRTKLCNNYADSDIDAECEKKGIIDEIKVERNNYELCDKKEQNFNRANSLLSMLAKERSNNYNDWLNVGFALHSISDFLLDSWILFSKKSNKYKEGECEKIWKSMKNPVNKNLLTIKSLAYWAKQDDPKTYDKFIKEEFKKSMKDSLEGTSYQIAKSIFTKYGDRFVCADLNKSWYEFKYHRWHKSPEGYSLQSLLSEEFVNEYLMEENRLNIEATKANPDEKEKILSNKAKISNIIKKLMTFSFKKTLMDECKGLFFDEKFDEKLNSNVNLIGFTNGVYDLENSTFRDGRPDDYISLSTNNEYVKWTDKNPYGPAINKFFSEILPNEGVRKYLLTVLSTCLSGETKDEKFYIMTGSGSNGKSLTMDLLLNSLGDYYMCCPITMMTNKRGKSNETSPEKVRMKGKRCGVLQEADDGEKLNVGVMKEFTGGDKILVRDLFKGSNEMIEYKPQMKYFLTCNQLPTVPSNDDGVWRRIRVIEFGSKFTPNPVKPNEFMIDNKLKDKIKLWAPSFISYLINIYNTYYKNCSYLVEPKEVLLSTNQYKAENDYYTEFILDKITVTDNSNNYILPSALWDQFSAWYKHYYPNSKIPKRHEFLNFMNKRFNAPHDRYGYLNIIFKYDAISPEGQTSSSSSKAISDLDKM